MSLKKLISHRGNISGPNTSLENNPEYILKAISLGYDCEVDIWFVNQELYLGHDKPTYKTNMEFLSKHEKNLWVHCKNFDALEYFNKIKSFNYFWHQEDDFTITSKGYIWTYPGNVVGNKSVIVDNENRFNSYKCFGVCSDYINVYK